ncbi:chemotaxis protein [Breoghania sp. L-A4]|nr:chemotaxis protein [Breoghania sp. L-A4]
MIIEGLVAVLLMLTIGYCVVLNGRLKRLRSDEEALRATISELITATEIAERAILGLKATANDCDTTLSDRLYEAERVSLELVEQISTGETVLGRISQIADAARPGVVRPQRTASTGHGNAAGGNAEPEAAPAPSKPMSGKDLKAAAAETAARLENFRRRSSERAA